MPDPWSGRLVLPNSTFIWMTGGAQSRGNFDPRRMDADRLKKLTHNGEHETGTSQFKPATAKEIFDKVSKEVVGLSPQIKALACRIALHSMRAKMLMAGVADHQVGQMVCCLIGESGVGKSFLASRLSAHSGLGYCLYDSSSLTSQGYAGADLDEPYARSLHTQNAVTGRKAFEKTMAVVRASLIDGSFLEKYGREGTCAIEDGDIRLSNAWLHYCTSASRPDASPQTIQQYEFQWGRLLDWLKASHPKVTRLSQVSRQVAQEFATHLSTQVSSKGVISVVPLKTSRTSGKRATIPIHPELAKHLLTIRPEKPAGPVCPEKAPSTCRTGLKSANGSSRCSVNVASAPASRNPIPVPKRFARLGSIASVTPGYRAQPRTGWTPSQSGKSSVGVHLPWNGFTPMCRPNISRARWPSGPRKLLRPPRITRRTASPHPQSVK